MIIGDKYKNKSYRKFNFKNVYLQKATLEALRYVIFFFKIHKWNAASK